jgi:hypothetical protein
MRGRKDMSVKNDAITEQEEKECKYLWETELAVQEWGNKNDLKFFGIVVAEWAQGKEELKPGAKAYFIDPGYKTMTILHFDIKEKDGKVTVSRPKSKAFSRGYKWPIKFARTREFGSTASGKRIDPVSPLYWVLVDRGIILPFRNVMKRGWGALPFEDMGDMKSTEI